MGSVIWWIGVLALALFFELCKRVGFRRACSAIWEFAGEIGPRDAAERRRRWNWRLYGIREDGRPPFCGDRHPPLGHRLSFVTRDEWDSDVLDYPPTGEEHNYREDEDDTPVTWPIQKWSDRR